ncbi:MAG: response regulator [Verrucomicrobiota bacterium JB022]|nr:response regulator [Verrucomicrobiota bacterium JB022]
MTIPQGLLGIANLPSPFWPAAGIALIGVMRYGYGILPGVFLGQFLVNITNIPSRWQESPWDYFLEYALMALGPVVMMAAIYAWTRPLMVKGGRLSNPKDWLELYFKAGPGGGLISCTWVAVVLMVFNRSGVTLHFWNVWWVGDTMGLVALLPLAVILSRTPRNEWATRLLSFGSLLSGAILIVTLVFAIYCRQHVERQEAYYASEMRLIEKGLQQRLDNAAQDLQLLARHYAVNHELPPELFRNLATDIHQSVRDVQAVTWMPIVAPDGVEAFEAEERALYGRHYRIYIRPQDEAAAAASPVKAHVPIAYTYPLDGNMASLGLDVLHHREAGEAIFGTLVAGESRMSPPMELVQERDGRRGAVIYLATEAVPDLAELNEMPTGRVALFSVVLRIDDVLLGLLKERPEQGYRVIAYDVTDRKSPILLSAVMPGEVLPLESQPAPAECRSAYCNWVEITSSGRTWGLMLDGEMPDIPWFEESIPLTITLGSVGFTTLLSLLCLAMFQRHEAIQHEVRQRTQQLAEAKEKAEQLTQAKGTFLATMSHEIRTPLNGIIATSELLRESDLRATQREYADIIHQSSNVLLAIINDILDYSKLEAGKLELDERPFMPGDLARQIASIFTVNARQRGLAFNLELPAPADDHVALGDPARISQIVINLLGNALKFTPYGFVALRCVLERPTRGRIRIVYEVQDSGLGIPQEQQGKLFQAFQQAHRANSSEGTGLGLAISRQIAEAMDARLWFESEEGKGTSFFFEVELPEGPPMDASEVESTVERLQQLSLARMQEAPAIPPIMVEAPSANGHARGCVLVVEDNQVNQRVATLILNKLGYSVDIARSGREGIERWKEGRHQLMLLDCQLPDIDGFEVARRIRKEHDPEHLRPIVAMTAHRLEGDRDRCLAVGMDDYISKPVQIETLRQLLEKWIPAY